MFLQSKHFTIPLHVRVHTLVCLMNHKIIALKIIRVSILHVTYIFTAQKNINTSF